MFYTRMFQEEMKRDPTNVELFDMAQSNSEHRHVSVAGCVITHGVHSHSSYRALSSLWTLLRIPAAQQCVHLSYLDRGFKAPLISLWHSLQLPRLTTGCSLQSPTGSLERS